MFCSIGKKEDVEELKKLEVQSWVNDVRYMKFRLTEKLLLFTYFFEPVTAAIEDTTEKLLEVSQSTKAMEELNDSNMYVKFLKLMNKNGLIGWYSMRPLASLIKSENKSQFWRSDDPNGNCCDFVLNVDKITLQGRSLLYKESWKN